MLDPFFELELVVIVVINLQHLLDYLCLLLIVYSNHLT